MHKHFSHPGKCCSLQKPAAEVELQLGAVVYLELVSLLRAAGEGQGRGGRGGALLEAGNAVDGQADGEDGDEASSAQGAGNGANISAAEGTGLERGRKQKQQQEGTHKLVRYAQGVGLLGRVLTRVKKA